MAKKIILTVVALLLSVQIVSVDCRQQMIDVQSTESAVIQIVSHIDFVRYEVKQIATQQMISIRSTCK